MGREGEGESQDCTKSCRAAATRALVFSQPTDDATAALSENHSLKSSYDNTPLALVSANDTSASAAIKDMESPSESPLGFSKSPNFTKILETALASMKPVFCWSYLLKACRKTCSLLDRSIRVDELAPLLLLLSGGVVNPASFNN